ncbi:hypothetical protein ACFX1S_026466 [Malus domestica]
MEPGTSQPEVDEILETDLPDLLLFALDSRGQVMQEKRKYGMNHHAGECSGKCEPTTIDKPHPYRPSPLANKGGEARWR